jgi:hypothetical protein
MNNPSSDKLPIRHEFNCGGKIDYLIAVQNFSNLVCSRRTLPLMKFRCVVLTIGLFTSEILPQEEQLTDKKEGGSTSTRQVSGKTIQKAKTN